MQGSLYLFLMHLVNCTMLYVREGVNSFLTPYSNNFTSQSMRLCYPQTALRLACTFTNSDNRIAKILPFGNVEKVRGI